MEDKKKLLDEALARILAGPVGTKSQQSWDTSSRQKGMIQPQLYTPTARAKHSLGVSKALKGRKNPWNKKVLENRVKSGNWKPNYNEALQKPVIATRIADGEEIYLPGISKGAKILGINITGINHCLMGLQKKSAGYTFKYAEKK